MPAKNATRQARKTQSPSAQAGEYVRQEIEHVREGKHGARSAKQVIAFGLSKARRAGVKLPPPPGKKPLQSTGRIRSYRLAPLRLPRSKLVKNATLKVYAGAPHGLTETHKDQLNADLLAFLKT